MKTVRLMIVDDHAVVRTGLAALLEAEADMDVVGEADDGTTALAVAAKCKPDLIIMDLIMPDMDGITATQRLKKSFPETKVLILTNSMVSDELYKAQSAGADAIVTKSTDNDRLIAAIRTVASGKSFVSPEIIDLISKDPPAPELSPRQIQILDYATRGLTNAEISKLLSIRKDSVKNHLNLVFEQLGAANRAEAVAIALRKHLLKI